MWIPLLSVAMLYVQSQRNFAKTLTWLLLCGVDLDSLKAYTVPPTETSLHTPALEDSLNPP